MVGRANATATMPPRTAFPPAAAVLERPAPANRNEKTRPMPTSLPETLEDKLDRLIAAVAKPPPEWPYWITFVGFP